MMRPRDEARTKLLGTEVRDLPTECVACEEQLFDEGPTWGYAYRFSEDPTFNVARMSCPSCERSGIESPTLGAHDIQFRGRIANGANGYLLADVVILEYSGPAESSGEASEAYRQDIW